MIQDVYTFARQIVESSRALGYDLLPDGTQLTARVPHVAPSAWLHKLYGPLSEAEILQLEERIGRAIPSSYRSWLRLANGFSAFSQGLVLDGLRKDYSRRPGVWEPYDLALANVIERLPDAPVDAFFIGSVLHAQYLLYLMERPGSVHACSRVSADSIVSWESFAVMVYSVLGSLSTAFDAMGRQARPLQLEELALTRN